MSSKSGKKGKRLVMNASNGLTFHDRSYNEITALREMGLDHLANIQEFCDKQAADAAERRKAFDAKVAELKGKLSQSSEVTMSDLEILCEIEKLGTEFEADEKEKHDWFLNDMLLMV